MKRRFAEAVGRNQNLRWQQASARRVRSAIVRPSRPLGIGIQEAAAARFPRPVAPALPEELGGFMARAGVQNNNYWSGTSNANNTSNAWNMNMNNGNVNNNNKTNNNYVWPVRSRERRFAASAFFKWR